MPFDSTPTCPAAFTLADLIAWLRTKDPNEHYCYTDSGHCLLGQFLRETGICSNPSVMSGGWASRNDPYRRYVLFPGARFPVDGRNWANDTAVKHPRTFGAALERALAYFTWEG